MLSIKNGSHQTLRDCEHDTTMGWLMITRSCDPTILFHDYVAVIRTMGGDETRDAVAREVTREYWVTSIMRH